MSTDFKEIGTKAAAFITHEDETGSVLCANKFNNKRIIVSYVLYRI